MNKLLIIITAFITLLLTNPSLVEARGFIRHAHIRTFRITVHATGKLRHYRVLHVKKFKL